MRASLSVSRVGSSVAKDPDILEKLDPRGMMAICQRYQSHFKHCAGMFVDFKYCASIGIFF